MNKEVRAIIVDGTEIMTSLTAVEIADRLRTYDDYKSRCEKAIEYIKDKGLYEEELDIFNDDINYNELDDLLNILNGSDNNE